MISKSGLKSVSQSVLIGVSVGYAAIAFRWLIDLFHHISFIYIYNVLIDYIGKYAIVAIPAIGGLIIGPLIYNFAKETKGHGVPEVLDAVHQNGGKIRPRIVFFKALLSALTIGFGGSVGREGPIVQIGSAIGSSVGQFFKISRKEMKNLVACGAAAGIAATFNAPIAGVFFALEVILRQFNSWAFSSIVIASVSASVVSRIYLGNFPAFLIPEYFIHNYVELFYYIILGVACAIVALIYTKSIYFFEDLFDAIKVIPEWLKPMIGGLILGSIALFLPQILGVGYESIEKALMDEFPLIILFLLLFFKIIATSITIGAGGSGGVFAPALFVGAMFGGLMGKIFQMLTPGLVINPAAYAVVGMGALFAGTAQAPISAVIILFEMTNNYKLILPLMLAVGLSTIIYNYFSKSNIYTLKLLRRGVDIDKLVLPDIFSTLTVEKAMTTEVISVYPTTSIREVLKLIGKTKHKGFPVLSEAGDLVGMITSTDIDCALDNGKRKSELIATIFTKDISFCYLDENLNTALKKLGQKNIGRMPVVDANNEKLLLGLISRKNIIKAYNNEIHGTCNICNPD